MTRYRSDRRPSTFDAPLETAYARIAGLQAEVAPLAARRRRPTGRHGPTAAPWRRASPHRRRRRARRRAPLADARPLTGRQSTSRPPLTTVAGRRMTSMSSSGSVSTATRSAIPAGRERPHPVLPAHQLGRDDRRRPDRLERRLTQADLVAELDRDHRVRVDPAVGAIREPDTRGDRLAEALALGQRRLLVLLERLGRPPGAPALLGDPVAVVDVGHEVGPARDEHRDALVVDERAVLDRSAHPPGWRP